MLYALELLGIIAFAASCELYVTTCIAGGLAGLVAFGLGATADVASAIVAGVTITFRLATLRFGWTSHWGRS